MLRPLQAGPEAIQLEVFLLERPAEDPLVSSEIWKDIDQIGALPTEKEELLRQNGFRLGIVSSNPPSSVQKLLGWVAEISSDPPEYAQPIMGRHHYLPPGIETEIPTCVEHDKCEIQFREGERTKVSTFEQVNCVLRMKAQRLHDGWVRIDFQPEVHHGDRIMRRTASVNDWSLRGGQEIDVRHSQRFSVDMNVDERVLITAIPHDDQSLGDRFFCRNDQGTKKQRVLVVRVVNSGQAPSQFPK